MESYNYFKDERTANILWLSSNVRDVVWYADLSDIKKSFDPADLLEVGSIEKCPFGETRKLYRVKFLGLAGV